MSRLVLLNKINVNHRIWIVFYAFCILLCGSTETEVPTTEVLTVATTGLEDVFSEVETQALAIKNISVETNDNDEYYLNWYFHDRNNGEFESTIDVLVKNNGPMNFFRHIKKLQKSDFYKLDIGKLEKCSVYYATIQAHNKFGESEKYHYTFETNPHNIDNVQLIISGNNTAIKWNSVCPNFQVTLARGSDTEVFHLQNNTNQLYINRGLYCVKYSITALSANGSKIGDEIKRRTVPGDVTNLTLSATDTTISATWTPPSDESCLIGYKIKISSQEETDVDKSETSYTYNGLLSCMEYTISVTSVSADDQSTAAESAIKTSTPDNINPVNYMTLNEVETDNSIEVKWTPVHKEKMCIRIYLITVDGKSTTQIAIPSIPEQTLKFFDVKPCHKYTVDVVAVINTNIQSQPITKEHTANGKAHAAPTLNFDPVTGPQSTSMIFTAETETANQCQLTHIYIECESGDALPWIVKKKDQKFEVTDLSVDTFELEELSVHTNYTCTAISFVDDKPSLQSNAITANTEKISAVPTYPKVTEETANTLKIEWKSQLPSKEGTYSILNEISQPMYDIPTDCPLNHNFMPHVTKDLFYKLEFLEPSFQYNISIKSSSWLGESDAVTTTGGTKATESGPVRDLKFDITEKEITIDAYNVTASLSWIYPCYTNGVVNLFKISIDAINLETNIALPQEFEASSTHFPELDYNFVVALKPFHSYAVNIFATDGSIDGLKQNVNFESPEGYSDAPVAEIPIITSESFNIAWVPPKQLNGKLEGYKVTITDNGPMFDIPVGCDDQIGQEATKETTDNSYTYDAALPYHEYKIEVSAKTGQGYGKVEPKTAITLGSMPHPVRDIIVGETPSHSSDEYSSTMHVQFAQSCNLAGEFKEYEIHIIGTRNNSEGQHDEVYQITNVNEIENNDIVLRAEHDYEVTVRVITSEGTSAPQPPQKLFSTSGVPGIAETWKITPPDSESIMSFLPSSFTDIHGDVIYFAILLSANYNFEIDYGYWATTWPEVGEYSIGPEVIKPYQITEDKWQPTIKEEVVTFPIGSETCEDQAVRCNGPLRADTTYTITVRGFTKNGYRDISSVSFDTPSVAKSISLGVILGITFGVIFTGLIFLGTYMFYRKRMFRSKKAIGRTNAVNPIRSANGAPAFPPAVNKQDDQDNARDFVALQRTSEKQNGDTSVAEDEENRKRNRYINILPFDSTRVLLYDGVGSDYINASFIKGYSTQIEYIAAQGPLESTVEDFWKMVAQEKVTTILMLTQLREQNREKCFKYFPFNNENMRYNNMNLYCSDEAICKTYIRRKIVLDIGDDEFNIQHFQYTDWPDFNVPEGTENMIKFVKKIRKMKNRIGGVILVHCSAGVGRTGTLISIDILLQAIDDGKELNIFQTVLDLRSQRVNMVQNEKQFLYIGSCVEDYVKSRKKSIVYQIEMDEPIYANVNSSEY